MVSTSSNDSVSDECNNIDKSSNSSSSAAATFASGILSCICCTCRVAGKSDRSCEVLLAQGRLQQWRAKLNTNAVGSLYCLSFPWCHCIACLVLGVIDMCVCLCAVRLVLSVGVVVCLLLCVHMLSFAHVPLV